MDGWYVWCSTCCSGNRNLLMLSVKGITSSCCSSGYTGSDSSSTSSISRKKKAQNYNTALSLPPSIPCPPHSPSVRAPLGVLGNQLVLPGILAEHDTWACCKRQNAVEEVHTWWTGLRLPGLCSADGPTADDYLVQLSIRLHRPFHALARGAVGHVPRHQGARLRPILLSGAHRH